jgi:hypothetical protein
MQQKLQILIIAAEVPSGLSLSLFLSHTHACVHARAPTHTHTHTTQTPWPESASELYRPTEQQPLSAKLVPTFVDRGCHVVSVTDPYGRILSSRPEPLFFFFQAALQLYPWGWVDLVPDSLLLRKSGSTENRTQTSGSAAKNFDH